MIFSRPQNMGQKFSNQKGQTPATPPFHGTPGVRPRLTDYTPIPIVPSMDLSFGIFLLLFLLFFFFFSLLSTTKKVCKV